MKKPLNSLKLSGPSDLSSGLPTLLLGLIILCVAPSVASDKSKCSKMHGCCYGNRVSNIKAVTRINVY